MPRKNPTSVTFNETIQKIKDELAPIYGLKNILSAGLFMFSRLPSDGQKELIVEISKFDRISKSSPNPLTVREVLRDLDRAEREAPGTIIKFLSKEDIAVLDNLRKALGSEPQKKRKAKRG